MPSAAMPRFGLSSLTGLVLLGWSVVAMAEAAPTPVAPSPANPTPPSPDKVPAAATKPKTAKAQPAPKAVPAPESAAPATTAPASAAPAGKTAAPSPTGPATTTPTGESWGKPATDPSTSAASNQAPGGPTSPWLERNVSADNSAPPVYYVEAAPSPEAGPKSANPNAGPPNAGPNAGENLEPMHLAIDEPAPPPVPRHMAPRTALWLGARLGYFIPFGDLWGRCSSNGYSACDQIDGTKFSDVAATGPMVELDLGMRLGRNYMLYLGWERAQLGASDGPTPEAGAGLRQRRAESDFVGVGFRLSANPDDIGLLLDLAIGARRFRAFYEGDVELQLSEAPMESRLGIGADIRINRKFALSPMLTLGLGSFGKADWVTRDTVVSAIPGGSDRLTHGWLTLQIGGHFDLAGSQ